MKKEEPILIWVVDSRDDIVGEVQSLLAADDTDLEIFSDARRAVLHIRRKKPDLVVLGLAENTINPGELLVLRREFESVAEIPFVVLYGADDVVSIDDIIGDGVTDAVSVHRLQDQLVRRVRWQLVRSQNKKPPAGSRLSLAGGVSALRTFDFLTRVIESSPNAIVAAKSSGEIVLFNPAAEDILGWSREEALTMSVRRLYPAGVAERIMKLIRSDEHGAPGQIDSLREVVVHVGGELIPVEISAALVYEEGNEIATVGIFTDLRQQMQMEERLMEAMEALEQTQRQAVIAEVAGAASHELNQPLTSLLGYVDYLRKQFDDGDELHRVASTIYDDAERIADVVRKIGRITRYRTREYAGGQQIVDLEEASEIEDRESTSSNSDVDQSTPTADHDRTDQRGEGEDDG